MGPSTTADDNILLVRIRHFNGPFQLAIPSFVRRFSSSSLDVVLGCCMKSTHTSWTVHHHRAFSVFSLHPSTGPAVQEGSYVPHATGGPSYDHRGVLPLASSSLHLWRRQTPDDGDVGSRSSSRCSTVSQGNEGVAEGRSFELPRETQGGGEGDTGHLTIMWHWSWDYHVIYRVWEKLWSMNQTSSTTNTSFPSLSTRLPWSTLPTLRYVYTTWLSVIIQLCCSFISAASPSRSMQRRERSCSLQRFVSVVYLGSMCVYSGH